MILIRHGEKKYVNNSNNKFRLDSPVTRKGKLESALTCLSLLETHHPPSRIVSSPYLRARQTAEEFKRILELQGIFVEIVVNVNYSECLIHQKDKVVENKDLRKSTLKRGYIPPETKEEHFKRVASAIQNLKKGDWVITHGYFISTAALLANSKVNKEFNFSEYTVLSDTTYEL